MTDISFTKVEMDAVKKNPENKRISRLNHEFCQFRTARQKREGFPRWKRLRRIPKRPVIMNGIKLIPAPDMIWATRKVLTNEKRRSDHSDPRVT
jgi:hypothetical protein